MQNFLNYVILYCSVTMEEERLMVSDENKKYSKKQLLLISFALPFTIMLIIYIAMGVYPFGKETLLTIDLAQQYVDFFSYYRHTLLHEPQALFY